MKTRVEIEEGDGVIFQSNELGTETHISDVQPDASAPDDPAWYVVDVKTPRATGEWPYESFGVATLEDAKEVAARMLAQTDPAFDPSAVFKSWDGEPITKARSLVAPQI